MKRASAKKYLLLLALAGGVAAPTTAWLMAADAPAKAATLTPASEKGIAKAQQTIDKAVAFLKSKQQADGGWTTDDRQPPAISAVVLRALVLDPKTGPKADFVEKGFKKLLGYQLENGGIYKDLLANYNTAIAVSALAAANQPEYTERIKKAVEYLKGLQWTDAIVGPNGEKIDEKHPWHGGWGYGGQSRGGGRPDLSNAQLTLEALHDSGLDPNDPAYKRAQEFIKRLQNFEQGKGGISAGNDGGFIYGPGKDGKGESFAGEYLDANGRRILRSYGSMTYAGLKSMIYAGMSKDDARVKAAWDWVRNNWTLDENPGMKLADPKNANFGIFYYYLTVARALAAYGEPTIVDPKGDKHDWRLELIDKLSSLQKEDGSFVGDKKWMEDNAVLTTGFVVLALEEAQADLRRK